MSRRNPQRAGLVRSQVTDREFPVPKIHEWATYVRGRAPEFKTHGSEGHAHSAINNKFRWKYIERDRQYGVCATDCALYRLVNDGWQLQLQWNGGDQVPALPWQDQPEPIGVLLAKQRKAAVERTARYLERELLSRGLTGLSQDATNSMKDLIERFVRDAKRITLQ